MLPKVKRNLVFSGAILKEVTFLSGLLLLVLFILIPDGSSRWIITISILTFSLLLLYILGEKRFRELNSIEAVIHAIRKDMIKSAEDIYLDKGLLSLQKEVKKMFLRLQNDINYLKRLEKVRSEFLGNVSHELRTPIFTIQGFIETLLDGAIDDPRVNRSFLEKAARHTENLNNLLSDLIDISMIESHEMHLSFRYFKLNEFLDSVLQELLPLAEDKKLSLKLVPIREDLKVYGDKMRLKQVLVNLIGNAIKYTDEGTVELSAEEEENLVRIVVRDTGIGISKRDLPRIFERFFRVDKDRSRTAGGTGLGLAIVKHIVEAHGSTVDVMSVPGIGSQFSFRLKK
ncbi:MAG: two-component sensor histidine kinase [Ignavibacteria bacterium]|nr:two-component sensor histidine kinase [Ignavibacteria bacterium]MCU7511385.1 two-component sensor histidine kinase [Ignavibacteria bacterium]MCU7523400.1 two-component sensor histidine kinase [Ignavibacteria bacterium]